MIELGEIGGIEIALGVDDVGEGEQGHADRLEAGVGDRLDVAVVEIAGAAAPVGVVALEQVDAGAHAGDLVGRRDRRIHDARGVLIDRKPVFAVLEQGVVTRDLVLDVFGIAAIGDVVGIGGGRRLRHGLGMDQGGGKRQGGQAEAEGKRGFQAHG